MVKDTVYYLYLKNSRVLRFTPEGDTFEILGEEKLPIQFRLKEDIVFEDFKTWIAQRYITMARSLTDCYWIGKEGDTWEDTNLYTNAFNELVQDDSKCWKNPRGQLLLYKRDEKGKEAAKEVFASYFGRAIGVRCVSYKMNEEKGITYCKCDNLSNQTRGLVPVYEIVYAATGGTRELAFTDWLKLLYIFPDDLEDFYTMLLFDGIIGNVGRHLHSWGYYMDTDTGNLLHLYPLLGHNKSLNPACNIRYAEMPSIYKMTLLEGAVEACRASVRCEKILQGAKDTLQNNGCKGALKTLFGEEWFMYYDYINENINKIKKELN